MAVMKHQSTPVTAKVTMEIVYSDKSKEIIETSELNVAAVPRHGGDADDPHIRLGVETPWNELGFRPYLERVVLPPTQQFCLDIRLPAANPDGYLYTQTKIEAPDTSVVMTTDGAGSRIIPCNFDEKVAALKAEQFGTSAAHAPIYFLLDIP